MTNPPSVNAAEAPPTLAQRFRGSLLGLAAGDALGASVEFMAPGTFRPLDGIRGGGPFGLAPGQWTDDTSMALCLAESLAERGGFDAGDQMTRYLNWYLYGYLSSTGRCFDIGNTVRAALLRFEQGGDPYAGSSASDTAGNGSLMRLAPVPLFYWRSPEEAVARAADSSRTTHAARAAVDACRLFAALLVGALEGRGKEELLDEGFWSGPPLAPEIEEVARGSFKRREPPAIVGSGYVVRSLEAALWAFHRGETFRDACLLAANLGNDADTTAAICGQLAGAYHGEAAIPPAWRDVLAMRERIEALADRLLALSAERP